MITITLHDTDTEEIVGMVTPQSPINFDKFENVIRKSFIAFHKSESFNDGDYSIEDFVEYHNANNSFEIDWVANEFIQLSEHDVK
jgi:hypothetical protein